MAVGARRDRQCAFWDGHLRVGVYLGHVYLECIHGSGSVQWREAGLEFWRSWPRILAAGQGPEIGGESSWKHCWERGNMLGRSEGVREARVGFGVPLGMRVIPTFALRLPPAEVQGALQGYRSCLSAFQTSLCSAYFFTIFCFGSRPKGQAHL